MGIGDRAISPGSPWQNGHAERLIGTVRRECLDRMLIFGESHLRRTLSAYAVYYNQMRTHLALQKDAPLHRPVQRSGASPSPSWPDYIINTCGYDFRKGQDISQTFAPCPLCARSGHSSVRFVIFIPSDADYDGRRADWIFERKKLKPRGDYV